MKIFLIGLMGSGKSFWAEKLGYILNIPVFHLDDEIEKKELRTIAEVFAEQGENYFRIKESEVLKSFAGKENFVLSTGGGTPCFHDNMKWMNDNGITTWIDEPVEIIEERLKKEKQHRPLITSIPDDQLKAFLSEMLNKRSPFYTQAKYHLNAGTITDENFLKIFRHE